MPQILIFILFLIVGIIFYFLIASLIESTRKAKEAMQRGIPATATVRRVLDSISAGSYDGVDMELMLEVQPPSGDPYGAISTWAVRPAAVSKVQEGCRLAVKIDPEQPQRIYPAVEWAEFLDVAPGSLSDPQD